MRVLWLGWTPTLSENSSRPNDGIHRSARHAVFGGLALGLILGLTFEGLARAFDLYQAFGMKSGAALPGGILALGIAVGLQAGVTIAIRSGGDACAMHYALRARLAWARVAPFRLRRFLDESTDRLLLRRSGGAYRFTHRLMQEHFASMPDELAAAGGRHQGPEEAQRGLRPAPGWSYLPTLAVVVAVTSIATWVPISHIDPASGHSWFQALTLEAWLLLAGFEVAVGLRLNARHLLDELILMVALLYMWLLTSIQLLGSADLASSTLQLAWPLLATLSLWWMGSLRQRHSVARGASAAMTSAVRRVSSSVRGAGGRSG